MANPTKSQAWMLLFFFAGVLVDGLPTYYNEGGLEDTPSSSRLSADGLDPALVRLKKEGKDALATTTKISKREYWKPRKVPYHGASTSTYQDNVGKVIVTEEGTTEAQRTASKPKFWSIKRIINATVAGIVAFGLGVAATFGINHFMDKGKAKGNAPAPAWAPTTAPVVPMQDVGVQFPGSNVGSLVSLLGPGDTVIVESVPDSGSDSPEEQAPGLNAAMIEALQGTGSTVSLESVHPDSGSDAPEQAPSSVAAGSNPTPQELGSTASLDSNHSDSGSDTPEEAQKPPLTAELMRALRQGPGSTASGESVHTESGYDSVDLTSPSGSDPGSPFPGSRTPLQGDSALTHAHNTVPGSPLPGSLDSPRGNSAISGDSTSELGFFDAGRHPSLAQQFGGDGDSGADSVTGGGEASAGPNRRVSLKEELGSAYDSGAESNPGGQIDSPDTHRRKSIAALTGFLNNLGDIESRHKHIHGTPDDWADVDWLGDGDFIPKEPPVEQEGPDPGEGIGLHVYSSEFAEKGCWKCQKVGSMITHIKEYRNDTDPLAELGVSELANIPHEYTRRPF